MKKTITKLLIISSIIIVTAGCTTMEKIKKNHPQESQFMKVKGGGYFIRTDRQREESYGMVVALKNPPKTAKYIIADFEFPNNPGLYDRKVFPIGKKEKNILVNSNPIYGVKYGYYYIKIYLSEDKKGEKVIDSLEQSIQIIRGLSKGRDYAEQYTLYGDGKQIKKLLVIYPNNRKKKLITAEVSDKFKMGHAGISFDESIIEYIPNNQTVHNWTKIITLLEGKPVNRNLSKPSIYAVALGNSLYNKFSKTDKDIQVTYAGVSNGKFFNTDIPDWQKKIQKASEVGVYVDYADYKRKKKYPNQREYLSAKILKSDVSVWQFQYTIRYDKRWSKEKIESLKQKARRFVNALNYVDSNPIDNLDKLAAENGIKNFYIEKQRLDDRDLNETFAEKNKSNTNIFIQGKKGIVAVKPNEIDNLLIPDEAKNAVKKWAKENPTNVKK